MNQLFHKEVRQWILALIRQRRKLIDLGRSRANTALMNTFMEHLEKHLQAYSYNNNMKMAAFFDRNRAKIHALIPGEGSSCHKSLEKQYQTILYYSLKLLQDHENLPEREDNPGRLCESIS